MTAGTDVVTFGCRLNIVESEAIGRHAAAAGLDATTVVNTCAVTAEAARQARQAIRRLRREHPERRIVVTGCGAEVEPDVYRAMPEVNLLVPNRAKTEASTWAALAGPAAETLSGQTRSPAWADAGHTRGFIAVQNGCDHRCTFCVIPFGRGESRSVPADGVVARARTMAEAGIAEIVLTGVDLTAWGADLPGGPTLGRLVKAVLAGVPDLARLRVSSIDCVEADPDVMDAVATEPRFMPHLHLSLQSGSDLILKRMKRRHGRADAVAFCRDLRALRPDMVFGADLIAGFPTETEAMFADSLSLVDECGLTHLHVFPFSPRPGTPAARMPPVPAAVARERAARLRARGDEALRRHLDAQRGRTLPVLMEQGGRGRTADFCAVRVEPRLPAGQFAAVTIAGHDGRELTGHPAAR